MGQIPAICELWGRSALRWGKIGGSVKRVNERERNLIPTDLDKRANKARKNFEKAIEAGAWRTEFPGREILKTFVGKHVSGASYETFRNLVLDKMTLDQARRPTGMAKVLEQIEKADTTATSDEVSAR